MSGARRTWKVKPLRCWLGWHDVYCGGLPPMWSRCRKCMWSR